MTLPDQYRRWRHDEIVREQFVAWLYDQIAELLRRGKMTVSEYRDAHHDLDAGYIRAAWGRVQKCS